MGKWPHELANVPADSYLFMAYGVKEEQDNLQKLIEAKRNV